MSVAALVLAAGAGTRFGRPKATVVDENGVPWVTHVVRTVTSCGLDPVVVVLGAAADEAAVLVPESARCVVAHDWATGMAASLCAGLTDLASSDAQAVVITLVDQPTLPAAVLDVLLTPPVGPEVLRRPTFEGRPGHPVLIGRDHWAAAMASATGDRGAGPWLATQGVELVPADTWWDGRDHDHPS